MDTNPLKMETYTDGAMETTKKRSFRDYLLLSLKGFCMGASDVVPGVSGGTMAFILGIYQELIYAIKSFDMKALRILGRLDFPSLQKHVSWEFLAAVGIGILTAVFSLARVLTWLLQNEPILIWSFFFGLIVASVVTVSRRVESWRLSTWIWAAGGILGAYVLVGLVPMSTPDSPAFLFLSGAIAICAMILPGISGAFILVLLGKYQVVLEAVAYRDFSVLALVAAGACVGIMAFSRLLGWLFRRYPDPTVALLTGLMLGSLRKVWPWKEIVHGETAAKGTEVVINVFPAEWDGRLLAAVLLMALGFLVVLLLDRMGGPDRKSFG
jgi:putative membrane protein